MQESNDCWYPVRLIEYAGKKYYSCLLDSNGNIIGKDIDEKTGIPNLYVGY